MKKTSKMIFQVALVVLIIFSFSGVVHGQINENYTVLAPLPGIGYNQTRTTTFSEYLGAILNLSIGIAAVMAFVMITFGGIMYATSDAISGKQQGREYIENALWGLLLVIGAYVILYTINPNILNFTLNPGTPPSTASTAATTGGGGGGGVLPGYSLTAAQIETNNAMSRDLWENYGVRVNNGPCTNPAVTTGCTNVVGLPDSAYRGVVGIREACECSVIITGGTEGGHVEHGPGRPVLDIDDNQQMFDYVNSNRIGDPVQTRLGPLYTVRVGGRTATFLRETDGGTHWHVVFR